MYFIVANNNGNTYVYPRTKRQLLKELHEGLWEDILTGLPDSDTNMWDGQTIIIKGEIVVPIAEKTVETWGIK